jgi:hypothetical protein
MTEHQEETTHIAILSIYRDLAEAFLEPLAPEQIDALKIGDSTVGFELAAGELGTEPAFKEYLSRAQAVGIVVRFLDVLSLEKIRSVYRQVPLERNVPVAIFILRDHKEIDFKISCPSCGQKLWLRDPDVGKRGRCPNCKKPFIIPSQSDYLKTNLMLAEGVPVVKVVRNDFNSFKDAIIKLLASQVIGITPQAPGRESEALKRATVRIQIQEDSE